MKLILQEKITPLGNVGDYVTVKRGYARNYLLRRGKAVLDTPENRVTFEHRRAELEAAAAQRLSAAQDRAKQLEGFVVKIAMKAGEAGKLFGSVSSRAIAMALTEAGHKTPRAAVLMPAGSIRTLGTHEVTIHLHDTVNATVQVEVVRTEDS